MTVAKARFAFQNRKKPEGFGAFLENEVGKMRARRCRVFICTSAVQKKSGDRSTFGG